MNAPKLYTVREVAALLRVSARTVARETAAGRLPSLRIRSSVLYSEEGIAAYLELLKSESETRFEEHVEGVARVKAYARAIRDGR